MMDLHAWGRRIGACVALLVVAAQPARAQGNEDNWHPLSNGFDGFYTGLGAGGGLTTSADGIGTWVGGEDLRGSSIATFSGDFGYKMVNWRHLVCLLNAAGTGAASYNPSWSWWEFDGLNANVDSVFTRPSALATGLLNTGFGQPYGTSPSGSASFLLAGLPSFLGTADFVLPNGGLLPSSDGGTATLIAGFGFVASANLPTGCFSFELGFTPTTVAGLDDIDGWWHWNQAGPRHGTSRSYWGYSFDEVNLWQSNSVESAANFGILFLHPATTDFSYHQSSFEANTTAALAPNGAELSGFNTYATQTENTNPGVGGFPLIDLNGGYDVGRGAKAISLTGTTGVGDFNDAAAAPTLAPQDPAGGSGGGGGKVPTLGFHTWDTRSYLGGFGPGDGGFVGGERITWIAFDWDGFFGKDPSASTDITCFFGLVRRPFKLYGNDPAGVAPQALTLTLLPIFTHTTSAAPSGFPDPEGFLDVTGSDGHIAGTSIHLPTSPAGLSIGLPVPMEYGTSGLSPSGGLTCDPNVASTSGIKEFFVVD